ncbi:LysR family transcriptional regulator [Plantactinospora sp. WMMB334]|uniref:LysR family transcriptional regulator n=1 Tax=Plantactinospora sp. WMMB334 TaxID=3404119 RepID=UPI003B9450B2
MELRHLVYFSVTAEELNFRRAAERLMIAQSGLSQRIRTLERSLGVPLFDRTRAGVRLTAEGAALLPVVRDALDRADRVRDLARRLSTSPPTRLRIGYTRSAGAGTPLTIVTAFRARYPSTRITTSTSFTARNLTALQKHEIDVGFVRPPLPPDEGLEYLTIARETVVVAMHREHHLAGRRRVRRASLTTEPLVFFPEETAPGLWRSMIDQVYGPGSGPQIVRVEPSEEFMLAAVAERAGVTLLTETPAAVLRIPQVVVRRFSRPEPTVPLGIAWRRDDDNPAVAQFVTFAAEASTPGQREPTPG